MSHWICGEMQDIKCSIDMLKKILLGIIPEWEARLSISEEGSLSVANHKCNIKIKASERYDYNNKKDNYSDIGFERKEDGSWVIHKRDYGFNIEAGIKKQLAIEKIRYLADKNNAKLIFDQKTGKDHKIVLHVPSSSKGDFVA